VLKIPKTRRGVLEHSSLMMINLLLKAEEESSTYNINRAVIVYNIAPKTAAKVANGSWVNT
jgi:hypothetical protein